MSDDGEVVQVEFFQDGEPIGEASAPPYELEIALTSLETGSRTYSAVATDDVGNTGDDELSLSVNIVGGVTEKTNDTLFLGGFHDAEASAYAGGGLVARDGEVFLAGSDANDEGVILETDEELVVQWERRIGDGFRSRPALGDGARVVVAGPNSGDWEVHILDTGDGSSIDSIALGPVASVGAGLGPQLATYGNRLDVNENPTDVLRLDLLDGSQVALFEPGDVVTNITTALDTGTSFVAYGFDVGIATTPCANAARTCVASIAEDNSINWEAGLTDDAPGVPRLAPAPRDGVFAATDVYVEGPGSFRLFHISSTGEVLAERLLGEEALDTANEAGDRVMALAAHQGGGVVVCGALGPPVAGLGDTGLTPEPFVALYDRDLELVWESRDMIPPEVGGAYALGCATTALDVFVFGVRGQGIADDQNPIVEGQIWLARLGL